MLKIVNPKGLKEEAEKYLKRKEVEGPFIVAGRTGIGKSAIAYPLFHEQGCAFHYDEFPYDEFLRHGKEADEEMLQALEKNKGRRGLFERTIEVKSDIDFLLERGYNVVLLQVSFEEWLEWAEQTDIDGKRPNVHPAFVRFLKANPDCWHNPDLHNDSSDPIINTMYPRPRGWDHATRSIYQEIDAVAAFNNPAKKSLLRELCAEEYAEEGLLQDGKLKVRDDLFVSSAKGAGLGNKAIRRFCDFVNKTGDPL